MGPISSTRKKLKNILKKYQQSKKTLMGPIRSANVQEKQPK